MNRALILYLACLGVCYSGEFVNLGHLTVMDSVLGVRDLVIEKQNGFAVAEGDILLHKLPESSHGLQALIIMKLGGERWFDGIIPFIFDKNLPKLTQLQIFDAILLWEKHTHLHFVEISTKNHRTHPDYIVFTPAVSNCSSYVGRQGGPQPIKLSASCKTMNIAHEIGHALGLWHEQSRADRDAYVQIKWENIAEDYWYNFSQHLNDGMDYGEYDYESIMHYTSHAFSRNGKQTIIPLQNNVKIGQREQLSHHDIGAVNAMYP